MAFIAHNQPVTTNITLGRWIKGNRRKIGHVPPAPVPPDNTVAPAITGIPSSSNTLTCSSGTWSEPCSFKYQWFENNAPLIGEAGNTFLVRPYHTGHLVFCLVTASSNATAQQKSVQSNTVTIT